ncbi:MAG: hypothetical protein ABEK02_01925 [Haloquadratum sp.]
MGADTADDRARGRRRTVAAVAVSALLLVAGIAAVPTPADAADGLKTDAVDIKQQKNGDLRVTIPNRTGPFTGEKETVKIEIAGASANRTRGPTKGSYTYRITVEALTEMKGLQGVSLANAKVTVRHPESGANVTETLDLRYATFGTSKGQFTDGGGIRIDLGTSLGLKPKTNVPLNVSVGDTTKSVTGTLRYDQGQNAYLVLDRGTLTSPLGVFEDPQTLRIRGQDGKAPYLHGSVTVNVRKIATTNGTRVVGGISLTNPLFVSGRAYVVDVSPAGSNARYLTSLNATSAGALRVTNPALLAATKVSVTVTRDGSTVVDDETVELASQPATATLGPGGTRLRIGSLQGTGRSVQALWVKAGTGVERYAAELNASGGYLQVATPISQASAVLVDFKKKGYLYAQIAQQQNGGTGTATTTPSGNASKQGGGIGVPGLGRTNPLVLGGIAVVLLLVIGVLVVLVASDRGSDIRAAIPGIGGGPTRGGNSPGKRQNRQRTFDVTFKAVDELANQTYAPADKVVATRVGGNAPGQDPNLGVNQKTNSQKEFTLAGGTAAGELEGGVWQFQLYEKGQPLNQQPKREELEFGGGGGESRQIPISVPSYAVSVQVTGGVDNEPLQGATVEMRPDVGQPSRKPTDPNGRVQFGGIPRSASKVTFTANYEQLPEAEVERPIEAAARNGVEISIAPETGAVEVETTVGSRPWPDVEVAVTPASEGPKAYTTAGAVTTDESGTRRIEGLPTGEYELAAHPEVSAVETTGGVETVTVDADETTDVTLSIEISFALATDQRDRLDDLRGRIDDLTAASDRDTAIPHYYGTVLSRVLELAEAIESSPERAVEAGVPPGAAVDALLDAVDEGIDVVDGAMSERRNIKLFRACESMAPADASWDGDVDLDSFFGRAEEGGDHQRRALRDRLKETDEFLDEKWDDVGEIGPARKVHDRVGDLARTSGNVDDELTTVALAFVGICLLDAVESLFDHDALRERLNSGGY